MNTVTIDAEAVSVVESKSTKALWIQRGLAVAGLLVATVAVVAVCTRNSNPGKYTPIYNDDAE